MALILPLLASEMELSADALGMMGGGVFMGMGAGAYFWGAVADHYGRRPAYGRRAAHVARLRLHVGGVAGLRRADGVAHPLRRRRRRLPPRLDDDARRERAGHRAREQHRRDVLPLHAGRVLRGPPRLAHPADARLALARRHLRAGALPALPRRLSSSRLPRAPSRSHPISARSRCSPPSSPSSCCSRRRRGSRRAAATRRRGGRSSGSSRSTAAARARAAPTPRRRAPPARRRRQRRARRRKRRRRRRARRRTPRAGAARASARRAASSSCARCTRG